MYIHKNGFYVVTSEQIHSYSKADTSEPVDTATF